MSEKLLHATVSPLRPDTPNSNLQIGFVGLGSMGYLMARNLASHIASASPQLPPLIVYNRTSSKSQKLVEELGQEKVRVSESPGQLATECDVIITNLANDEVVKSIYAEFARAINVREP
jgi:3-hydroxyisobutyrate dehydrogenase-like beta-hydroxyacid dehydrogenase